MNEEIGNYERKERGRREWLETPQGIREEIESLRDCVESGDVSGKWIRIFLEEIALLKVKLSDVEFRDYCDVGMDEIAESMGGIC